MKYTFIVILIAILSITPIFFATMGIPVINTDHDVWVWAFVVVIYCMVLGRLASALKYLLKRTFPKTQKIEAQRRETIVLKKSAQMHSLHGIFKCGAVFRKNEFEELYFNPVFEDAKVSPAIGPIHITFKEGSPHYGIFTEGEEYRLNIIATKQQ